MPDIPVIAEGYNPSASQPPLRDCCVANQSSPRVMVRFNSSSETRPCPIATDEKWGKAKIANRRKEMRIIMPVLYAVA